MNSIVLIEDTAAYADMLRDHLEREGFAVRVENSGVSGLRAVQQSPPDLVILDLMLPHMGGYTVLQRLRENGINSPVLLLTARGTEEDKLRGFGLGADDYVVKPVGSRELLARVRALLKRGAGGAGLARPVIQVGELRVDLAARAVQVAGREVILRPKEFELLAALVRHRGSVVPRRDLLLEVWGYVSGTESRTLETHINTLRQRLGDDPAKPRYIVTVRRVGYKVAEDA